MTNPHSNQDEQEPDLLDAILRKVTGEFAAQYRMRNEAKEPYSIKLHERQAEEAISTAKREIEILFAAPQPANTLPTDVQANYVQVIEGSERCLNGHPVVEMTMDDTPSRCNEPNCEHYSRKNIPKPPVVQGDDWMDKIPLVHQFGCPALEREDGGLMDYSCTCGNEAKAKAAIQAQLDAAYQHGRIDEAKTCEEAKRHDMKGLYTHVQLAEAVREARIDELVNLDDRMTRQIDSNEQAIKNTKKELPGLAPALSNATFGWFQVRRIVRERLEQLTTQSKDKEADSE